MNIERYKVLIQNLPVRQQCFTTKRENARWKNDDAVFNWYEPFKDLHFAQSNTLTISRQDIFNLNTSIKELIIKTIYWGYPRGMRGNHFNDILQNINMLEGALEKLKAITKADHYDYLDVLEISSNIPGLGLSTLSKLLYFLEVSFNDLPCLILDQRLIDVFQNAAFPEYKKLNKINYSNASKYYIEYLLLTDKMASQINTKGENIEQFLFLFGGNLK